MLALVGALLLGAHAAAAGAVDAPTTLKLATWNLEWLIAPATFKSLKNTCVPKGASQDVRSRNGGPSIANERRLPCDVAQRLERSSRDFASLAHYARELNADVIALQEVDGIEAARLVFPNGYEFCFSGSPHLQNTGFAIRAGIPKRCAPDVMALSLEDSVRRGAEVVLFPGEPRELHLLDVHLKSGCASQPLESGEKACRTLARQVPALAGWIDSHTVDRHRFAVLGDFNRELLREAPLARSAGGQTVQLWPAINRGSGPEARLRNVAAGQPFRNCVPGQAHTGYIDHIVVGKTLAASVVSGSFERVTFSAADARHAHLSDHCPVAVKIDMRQIPRSGAP